MVVLADATGFTVPSIQLGRLRVVQHNLTASTLDGTYDSGQGRGTGCV